MVRLFFWTCLALLPSYLLKIRLGRDLSMPLLDLLLILFILFALFKIKDLYRWSEIEKQLKEPLPISAFFVVAGFCLSYIINFQASFWSDGAGIIKSFVILPILSGFCFSLLLRKKILSVKDLFWPVFVSSGALSVLGYFYAIKGVFTFDGRLRLFFESPNQLAMTLGAGFICGTSLLFSKQDGSSTRPRNKIFTFSILALLFFHLFSLALANSLGSWIGLVSAFLFAFLAKSSFWGFAKKMLPPLLLFFSLAVFLAPFANQQAMRSPITPPTSTDSRFAIYRATEKIIRENWLWGVGAGNFQRAYLEQQKFFPPYPQWAVPHAHNNLLHFWAEGGILAFLGLFFVLFFTFKTKKQTPSSVFAVSMLVYFSVHGLIDATMWKNDLAIIFWVFVFLASKTAWQKKGAPPDSEPD